MSRLASTLSRIDAANSGDPHRVTVDGIDHPAEQLYGERMSAMLDTYVPEASELLTIAARAQHIMRWKVPRTSYPEGRAGYHRWRNELKRLHGTWTAEIMQANGYPSGDAERVAALIRKENLKSDAEAQALEDTACLVFLRHYAEDFVLRHERAKCLDIVRKTWAKMSDNGRAAALRLDLSVRVAALVGEARHGTGTEAG